MPDSTPNTPPVRILGQPHLRATPDGHLVLRVRGGQGPVTVTLASARPLTPRWLGGTRARVVLLARRDVTLRPGIVTTIDVRLTKDHLALLHRMGTLRATIRVATHREVQRRRIFLHAPAGRRVGAQAGSPPASRVGDAPQHPVGSPPHAAVRYR